MCLGWFIYREPYIFNFVCTIGVNGNKRHSFIHCDILCLWGWKWPCYQCIIQTSVFHDFIYLQQMITHTTNCTYIVRPRHAHSRHGVRVRHVGCTSYIRAHCPMYFSQSFNTVAQWFLVIAISHIGETCACRTAQANKTGLKRASLCGLVWIETVIF